MGRVKEGHLTLAPKMTNAHTLGLVVPPLGADLTDAFHSPNHEGTKLFVAALSILQKTENG